MLMERVYTKQLIKIKECAKIFAHITFKKDNSV